MIYLALAAAVTAMLVWVGRGRARPTVLLRYGVAALALAAAAGAFYEALRAQWIGSAILIGLALYTGQSARAPKPSAAGAGGDISGGDSMSAAQARAILGVAEGASAAEIREAYTRLMKRVHPDVGGAPGLAAQLNAARDRLLG
jgi:hypothetical protein